MIGPVATVPRRPGSRNPASPGLKAKQLDRPSHTTASFYPRSTVKNPLRMTPALQDTCRQTVKPASKINRTNEKRISVPEKQVISSAAPLRSTLKRGGPRQTPGPHPAPLAPLFYLDWLVKGASNPYFRQVKSGIEATLHQSAIRIQKVFRGYIVRKLVKETLSCGFCTRFQPKLARRNVGDLPAAKLVESKSAKVREEIELMEKFRGMELEEPATATQAKEPPAPPISNIQKKIFRLRDLVGEENWGLAGDILGPAAAQKSLKPPIPADRSPEQQSKISDFSFRDAGEISASAEEIEECLLEATHEEIHSEGIEEEIEEDLIQGSVQTLEVEESIGESLLGSHKGSAKKDRAAPVRTPVKCKPTHNRKPVSDFLAVKIDQGQKENYPNRPSQFSRPHAPIQAVETQRPSENYQEEGCQADLEPEIGGLVFAGMSQTDRLWISETLQQELQTHNLQTEAILAQKISRLETTIASLLQSRPLPPPPVPSSLTYNVHLASPQPLLRSNPPLPPPMEPTKPVTGPLLSAQIDQLKSRLTSIRSGQALLSRPSEDLLDVLERQVWEELLGDALRFASQSFKRLNCA